MSPFLNRAARRRDEQLRVLRLLDTSRKIYTIACVVCTIMAPSSWKLLDPCVTTGSPVRVCAGVLGRVCLALDGCMQ